jgi:glycosyltransferase involved in cell wall biosynthesis
VEVVRVLWVTDEPPDFNLGGYNIRQAHLLEALAATVDVTLLLCGTKLRDRSLAAPLAGVIEIPPPTPGPSGRTLRRLAALTQALLPRRPPEVVEHRALRSEVRGRWKGLGSYDVVIVEHPGLAPLVSLRGSEKWLMTMHDVPSATLARQATLSSGRRRWLYKRQAQQARGFERWTLRNYDLVVAVSHDDARALPGQVAIVPNGVDTERFGADPLPAAPALTMIGTLGYQPNEDGCVWFTSDVLPLILRRVPEATLTLVGRAPTPRVLELGRLPGVSVHADVPEVLPFLHEARVSLVPLRFGSGTRLKALEAFAGSRPVVGTTVGLGGLGIEDRVHALIADDPETFAARVVELLSDDALAKSLVDEARRLVESRYSWASIGADFVELVLQAGGEATSSP